MLRPLRYGIVAVFVAVAGAASAAASQDAAGDSESRRYSVLRAALQLRDVPLRAHATCRDAAPVLPARSIGDYLAGFLANMDKGRNTVTTACQAQRKGQRCDLWLKHADGEDEWSWGIRFDMDRRGRALPGSVRCLGSG